MIFFFVSDEYPQITDDRWNNSLEFLRRRKSKCLLSYGRISKENDDTCILIASISRSISARFIAPSLLFFFLLFLSSPSRNAKDRCNNNLLNSDEAKWFIDKRNKLYSPPRRDIFPRRGGKSSKIRLRRRSPLPVIIAVRHPGNGSL